MKKILVSAIAAVAMAGVTCPLDVQAQTTTTQEHHSATDLRTAPLSGAHKMNYEQVPQKVKDAAKKRIGSSRVEDVDVGTINGKTVYELAYKKAKHGDKTFELRVMENGHVIGEHAD